MYLMYVDESGDTAPISQKGKKYLVLCGAVIHENDKIDIEREFRKIKDKFYQNSDVEIKSNFLRYANPDLKEGSPIKLHDRAKYDELETDLKLFLQKIPVELLSVVVNKEKFWEKYPAQNVYNMAYASLLQSFNDLLKMENAYGITIIDPREGQVVKKFMDKELDEVHHAMRWDYRELKCENIIEKVLFSDSGKTIGIQIADLLCYPIFHIFEYGKQPEDYWRYTEITGKKLSKRLCTKFI
ncbi:MAG: DUF3800 domain-containing protein [bacterium]|nr:DUF3800 domain-containing protein [bacterium]